MTSDVEYEYQTVKSIKGLESRTIAKMEDLGWDLVAQEPSGALRTALKFRRARKRMSTKSLIALASVGAAVVIALIIGGTIEKKDEPISSPPSESPLTASQPTESSAPESPSPKTSEAATEDTVLTTKNNSQLASIMKDTDYCSENILNFADQHRGKTIRFNANIGALNNHGSYKTRYDILIGYGDFDPNSQPGPAFQFRDVNTTSDLNYTNSNDSETIGVGDNIVVTAKVREYEPRTCLFLLDPVQTEFR